VREQLDALAAEVAALGDRVGELVYDALRTQTRGGEDAEGARELERQLARVRRSLDKASAILGELAGR
jgi:hypothetical protein